MNVLTSNNHKLKRQVLELIKFNQKQIIGHQKLETKLSGLISLIDSSLSTEESQNLANCIINSPKNGSYSRNLILCLTLRKIVIAKRESFKKFGFFMIRGVLTQVRRKSSRMNIMMKGRRYKKFILSRKKLLLEQRICAKDRMISGKYIKNWKNQADLDKYIISTDSIEKLKNKILKVIQTIFFNKAKLLSARVKTKEGLFILISNLKSILAHKSKTSKISTFHTLKILYLKSKHKRSLFPLHKALKIFKTRTLQIYLK